MRTSDRTQRVRPSRPSFAVALLLALGCSAGSGGNGPSAPPGGNAAPQILRAVPSQSSVQGEAGQALSFEVEASDPDGTPVTFEFLLDGDRVSTDSRFSFIPEASGSHELVVNVSDGARRVTYHWTIVVTPDVPNAPSATLDVAPDSGLAPLEVSIHGAATDADGTVVLYELDADGDGLFDLSGPLAPSTTRTYTAGGLYRIRLRVLDDDSLSTTVEHQVRVTVNQPPRAALSVSPTEGTAPLSARVRASGTDPENAIGRYELDADGDGHFEISSPAAIDTTLVFSDYTQVYTVTLRVTDTAGASDTAVETVRPRPDVDAALSSVSQDGTGRLFSDGETARTIRVHLVDPQGSPLSNVEVALSSSRNGGPLGTVDEIRPARGLTDGSGLFEAEFTTRSSSTLLGDAVVSAEAADETLAQTATVQFVTPVSTSLSALSCMPVLVHVDGSSQDPRESNLLATVLDAQGQPLPGMYVELKTRDASIWRVEPAAGRSDAAGQFRATLTSDLANDNTFVDFYADGHKTSSLCIVSFIP